ncbi:MAG TPA: NADH-quinone oxidoreductase subunit NuoB [Steroidobacteraceae bacterium]|nr:NADH-quinone oxidoreductase subunit NuoB [Steroidobacteraceae bacterium]
MPLWTLFGLAKGKVSTQWPRQGEDGQAGVLGMPQFDPVKCDEGCEQCAAVCLPQAITLTPGGPARLAVDYGRCVTCQLCVETCPTGAFTASSDWAFGVRSREDLKWADATASKDAYDLKREIRRIFGRSLHIRHVDAGSCNGCESELQALNNPFYNLHRLGIFFTPSPRFADLLLVTGPVTYAMRAPLREAYEGMPQPRFVMAVGTCAVSGGTNGGGYSCGNGLDEELPVDVYLPGCPPNPAAIIHALLMLLQRAAQRVHAGQLAPGGAHG